MEYKIESYYPQAVGTTFNPRYAYGEPQIFADTLYMEAGRAGRQFAWRSGTRDMWEVAGRLVEKSVTALVDNAPSLLAAELGIPLPVEPDFQSGLEAVEELGNALVDVFGAEAGPEIIYIKASVCGLFLCTRTAEIEVRAQSR